MRWKAFFPLLILTFILISFDFIIKDKFNQTISLKVPNKITTGVASEFEKKLLSKATSALEFAKQNNYNSNFCFLIDLSLKSAQRRFFVYNLDTDTVLQSGLVTHGRCNEDWLEGRRYSNNVGSGCTSLGKYRIGKSYSGRFGLAYKLFGLETSNSNAYKRYVVLHSHECVPAEENGDEIYQSDGCPTISPSFLRSIAPLIDNSAKPVLLWIYE